MEPMNNTINNHFPLLADVTSSTANDTGRRNYTLSIVDVFGFEKSMGDIQSCCFQQFCTNYVAEKIQQKYIHDIVLPYKIEFDREGINLPDFHSIDNNATVTILDGFPYGIIPTLNRQHLSLTGSSEVGYQTKLVKLIRNKSAFRSISI